MECKKDLKLIIAVTICALALILSTMIAMGTLKDMKRGSNTITVTGYAEKEIKSDFVKWTATLEATNVSTVDGYKTLEADTKKVENYLTSKGLKKEEIIVGSVNTLKNMKYDEYGRFLGTVSNYTLSRVITVKSNDIEKVTKISNEVTELINQGVNLQSNAPAYYYTKLSDLKVEMLGTATEDGRKRADIILNKTGAKVGKVIDAKMGVFQITPALSTEVSDMGYNDTESIDKKITATLKYTFEIK